MTSLLNILGGIFVILCLAALLHHLWNNRLYVKGGPIGGWKEKFKK